jgi:hypothetical protein
MELSWRIKLMRCSPTIVLSSLRACLVHPVPRLLCLKSALRATQKSANQDVLALTVFLLCIDGLSRKYTTRIGV